jgi:putative ABC transport system permease protein
MTTLRQVWARLGSFFRKQELDREFDEEVAAHIELATQDHLRQGMTVPEARRLALIKLGGVEFSREAHRESRGLPWLDGIVHDMRYALRTLRRSPGFTLTAIIMLALGIGVNVTVFTLTNALFRKPPFDRDDRIVYIHSRRPWRAVSYADFQDWKAQAKSFEGMAVVNGVRISLSDHRGLPESFDATQVSADAFQLVGQRPILGRDFAIADETPGAAPVAILSYDFWEHRYGKDPAIVGQTIRINGDPTTIIGVMARGFSFPRRQDLWMPLVPTPDLLERDARYLWFAFGRLAPGVTIESARAEMEIIGRRLANTYPFTNQEFPPVVQNSAGHFVGPGATVLFESMLGAVGFVLLIACANLANLTLARAIGRSREISLRVALGAERWRIIRQLFMESMILSAAGGVVGLLIAQWGVRIYKLAAFAPFPAGDPPWIDYVVDYRVLGYLVAISLGTGLLFGLTPALRLSRPNVNAMLKDGGRKATIGGRGKRLSAILVTGEAALAMVLLTGAGVMIRSFLNIYTTGVGVEASNVLTAYLPLPAARYPDINAQISFYDHLKTRLQTMPDVESIAIVNSLPTSPALKSPFELAGGAPVHEHPRPTLSAMIIGPAYFRTLGAAVLSGREFDDADAGWGTPVAIVNRRFAAEFWPGQDPLGKRLRLFAGEAAAAWLTVVGVVPNILQNDYARQQIDPLIYLPYRQNPGRYMWVVARTRVPPGSLETAFRREVQALDSDLPIFSLETLTERLSENYRDSGRLAFLFLIFAAIALLLASAGLYAVMAYSVGERTQEIGIRIAVGAAPADIFKLVFRQGMLPLGIGLTIGLAASFGVNRILTSVLIQVSPADPVALVAASAILVLSGFLGCLIPACRAMRTNPVNAIRHD